MCSKCNPKESLILPFPSFIDINILDEYIRKDIEHSLTNEYVFNTFQKLYQTNYDFSNEKAKHRAWQNMIQLKGYYLQHKEEITTKFYLFLQSNDYTEMQKIKVNENYIYEKHNDDWVLIEQSKPLKKGMKKIIKNEDFNNFDIIEFF